MFINKNTPNKVKSIYVYFSFDRAVRWISAPTIKIAYANTI